MWPSVITAAIAAMILASCAESRTGIPPPAIDVSMLITLNQWSWILEADRLRHAGGGSGRPQAGGRLADQPGAPAAGAAADVHRAGAGAAVVTVEIGYGEKIYDSCPIDRFAGKASIQAGLGVRNWIRIRDGERTIEVGSIAGRKGAGIIIELGPGISTSEY